MTRKRRSFTAAQKAEAVRKYLKDRVPVSQIADEMHVQPTMIHNWVNTALQQVEHAFESPRATKGMGSTLEEARRNCCGGVGAIGPVGHRLNHAAGFKTIGARRPCRILLHLRVFNKTIPRPTCSRAKAKPFQLACRTP